MASAPLNTSEEAKCREGTMSLESMLSDSFNWAPFNDANINDKDSLTTALRSNAGEDIFRIIIQGLLAAQTAVGRIQGLQGALEKNEDTADELKIAQADLKFAQAELNAYRDISNKLTTQVNAANSSSEHPRRSPEHPDPDKFNGKDPTKLALFLLNMALKMNQNADWWQTEQQRMTYYISRLDGGAHGQIAYAINVVTGHIELEGVSKIIDILKSSYGDVNEQQTAQTKILDKKNVQGSRPLAEFLPEWQFFATKSGFNDAALVAILRAAIHPELQERLTFAAANEIPSTLVGFTTFLRDQEARMRHAKPEYYKSNIKKPAPYNPPASLPATTDPSPAEDAMDLSVIWTGSQGGVRRPKNDAERAAKRKYCRENKLCYNCESPSHNILDCPTARHNKKDEKKAEN
jgi:hypothetical protein